VAGPFDWSFTPPSSAALGDHDVPLLSSHLKGKRIALLVGAGIAAMKAPLLARALRRRGAHVTAFCSPEALRYVGAEALEWSTCRPLVRELSWKAEHLSDGEDFAAYLVAPATYNTIGKAANGIADSLLTATLASALGRLARGETEVLMAPTMHGTMHHAVLEANCRGLAELGVRFLPPRDAYGKHNLPDEELIVAAVCRALSRSPLRGRRITGKFRGQLGSAIHEELLRRGADSRLILGDGGWRPAEWLPAVTIAPTYDAYRELVLAEVATGADAAVLSAAVADYRPRQVHPGKMESGKETVHLDLEPTEKVIDAVKAAAPGMLIVSFKYMEGVNHAQLIAEAVRRLNRYAVVVANRGEEISEALQVAWIVTKGGQRRVEGKAAIAAAIADGLEGLLEPQAPPPPAAEASDGAAP
jgi:phosphopantothenoylcysteine decarboxylase/phosphopantothenate--cysteine ligase